MAAELDRPTRPSQALRSAFLAHLGRAEEAREILQRFPAIVSDDDETSIGLLHTLFETALLLSETEIVRALAARLAAFADRLTITGSAFFGGSVGRLLGDAAAMLGEPESARGYYARALDVCAKVRFRPETALVRLHLAELLLANYPAEAATAQAHLDFAIEELRTMKMQPALERALRHKGLLHA